MSPGQESTGGRHLAPSSQKRHCTTIHLTTHSLDNLYKILKNINNLKEIFSDRYFPIPNVWPKTVWSPSYRICLDTESLYCTHIPIRLTGTLLWPPLWEVEWRLDGRVSSHAHSILEVSFPHLGGFLDLFFTGTDLGNLPILHRVTRKTRQKEHAGHGNIDFSPKSPSMCTKISQHWKYIMSARKVCYQPDIQCPA